MQVHVATIVGAERSVNIVMAPTDEELLHKLRAFCYRWFTDDDGNRIDYSQMEFSEISEVLNKQDFDLSSQTVDL